VGVGQSARFPGRVPGIDFLTKGARFVRFCDAFNIPILTSKMCRFSSRHCAEFGGIIRHAPSSCTHTPKPRAQDTVITRKAYGALTAYGFEALADGCELSVALR